jgi:fumarate hydratase class I
MTEFIYDPLFLLGEDTTEYRLLTKEFVRTREFEGSDVLLVEPRALTLLA